MGRTYNHGWLLADTLNRALATEPLNPEAVPDRTGVAEQLGVGSLLIEPNKFDRRIIVSAGIHGDETGPVELVDKLVTAICDGLITPTARILILFGNPQAMAQQSRFCEYNLNRLFCDPGDRLSGNTTYEDRRADELMALVSEFANQYPELPLCHFDLHTTIRGSLLSKFANAEFIQPNEEVDPYYIDFLVQAEMEALVLFRGIASTAFSAFTRMAFNSSSFTIELNSVSRFGDNDPEDCAGFTKALIKLIEGHHTPQGELHLPIYEVAHEIKRTGAEFELLIDPDTPNFTPLEKGLKISSDGTESFTVDEDGLSVLFPNPNVAVGQRSAIVMRPVRNL